MSQPRILIVSPATAAANNGNWQTAVRWARLLRPWYACSVVQHWSGQPADVLLALHARRSADSVARWAQAQGVAADAPGLALVLTGTDVYRDIQTDAAAQASLRAARQLVVLQPRATRALPAAMQAKTRVIFQSVSTRQTLPKTTRHLRAVMVGHLREEKSPQTLFAAAALLHQHPDVLIDHIGQALDADLGAQAQACAHAYPNYRWLGALPHGRTRSQIQRAHVLVHTSRMEGGAHVLMEAVCSGTPVLASHIEGNVGMLGEAYAGYFDHGDARALANLLLRCRTDRAFYDHLQTQCAARAPLFAPRIEQAALQQLVQALLPNPLLTEIVHQGLGQQRAQLRVSFDPTEAPVAIATGNEEGQK